MIRILPQIFTRFNQKLDYFRRFSDQEFQVEGWFKGEMVCLLSDLQVAGLINGFACEVKPTFWQNTPLQNQKIDLSVSVGQDQIYCELKSGCQRTRFLPLLENWIQGNNGAVNKDFQKLQNVPTAPNRLKAVLVFMYPKPPLNSWYLVANVAGWNCLTNWGSYPDEFLIGLWQQ